MPTVQPGTTVGEIESIAIPAEVANMCCVCLKILLRLSLLGYQARP
jgi:hypothetical protein